MHNVGICFIYLRLFNVLNKIVLLVWVYHLVHVHNYYKPCKLHVVHVTIHNNFLLLSFSSAAVKSYVEATVSSLLQ